MMNTVLNLKGRSLISLRDFSKEEIMYFINLAIELKHKKKNGIFDYNLKNKNVALLFEKPSTRTRCAFAVACSDEGASHEFLTKNDLQLGHKESVDDTARVLGRMFDVIEFRGASHETVEQLAKHSGVPVINGLTDADHPTQVLADFMTIYEHFGTFDINFVYIGDGRNNMANALLIGATKIGMNIKIVSPKSLFPEQSLIDECMGYALKSGSIVEITDDQENAPKNADVIYTDVWCSMGEEAKSEERINLLKEYQINKKIMEKTADNSIFMHCLPAVKGREVTEDVFESRKSVVFEEAENRLHTIKAVLVAVV